MTGTHPTLPSAWRTARRALAQLAVPVAGVVVATAAVLLAAAGATLWLLRSEAGTTWLLQRLPWVEVQGWRGALLSEQFAFERLRIDIGKAVRAVEIEGVQAEGVQWSWRPAPGLWVGVQARQLQARRVAIVTGGPSSPEPATMPASLDWRFSAQVDELSVDVVQVGTLPPILELRGRATIGDDGGRRHHVEQARARWDRVQLQAAGDIGTTAPFKLQLQAQAVPAADSASPVWQARGRAEGSLSEMSLDLTLGGEARVGRPAPALALQARVQPFAHWPLGTLDARTEALDLSALSSLAPVTRLAGHARLDSRSMDAPVAVQADLTNTLPGRWDEGRLPARRLQLNVAAVPSRRDHVDIDAFTLELASGRDAAGRIEGRGRWSPELLTLQTRVDGLRPQRLDRRAAPASLSGPLELGLRGLPWPQADPASRTAWSLVLRGDLQGRADAMPRDVSARLDLELSAQRLQIRELAAESGGARAALRLDAAREVDGRWRLRSDGRLQDFDPLPWWPGNAASPWREGPHRLSAEWELDTRLPGDVARQAPVQLLQTLVGSGRLHVHDALLAGVPLQADVALGQRTGTGQTPSHLRADLRVAGSRLQLEATGDPLGEGTADRLDGELRIDDAAALAPLARLLPALAPWTPRAGRVEARIRGEGRWPALRTEGRSLLDGVNAGELTLDHGELSWLFDTRSEQPLSARVALSGLQMGRQRLRQLDAELQGTAVEHRLKAQVELPVLPPAWAAPLLPGMASQGRGTRATLEAEGGWQASGDGGGRWSGRLAALRVGAAGAAGANGANGANGTSGTKGTNGVRGANGASAADIAAGNWFDASDIRAEARFSPDGGLVGLRAEPGRARVAQTLVLGWDEVNVQLQGDRPDFRLRARVEPFQPAPWLARLQPGMAWSGDLQLAGEIDLQAGERFDANAVFERRAGDLAFDDAAGRQRLGLQSFRLAVTAQDGLWSITPELAGTTLGTLNGRLTLRTDPARRWPDAQSPLQGRVQASVANLGIWNAWVPPGWRLAGQLATTFELGGRAGAPELTGRLQGRGIAVRNLLLGVDVTDGEVDVSLQGSSARIDALRLRAGDGDLTVTGGAELGAAPRAQLQAVATRLRVLGRVDRQLVLSGRIALDLRPERLQADGRLNVDEGLFDVTRGDAPALDDDVVIRGSGTDTGEVMAEATRGPRRELRVALDIDLGSRLRVRGRGLDTQLGGELRLTTPGSRLAVHGAVRTADGTYAAYGQKLTIARGVIAFQGPLDNPSLDILALRPNLDEEVGVAISGSLVQPRVRLYSDPEMSDTDKLSWLVLGRPSEGLGRADTALLQRAAVALLAGEGEAPTDALLRQIGIDELSFRQADGDVRETVVSLGKHLSRRWYVGYERGVNATAGTWQLVYRIAQRFTLRAQSGFENSLDLIWVWRTDDPSLIPVPPVMRKSPVTPP